MAGPLGVRLVNPYEQKEQQTIQSYGEPAQNPHHRNAVRQSFGPGDPLFSAPQQAASQRPDYVPRPPPSPRPAFWDDSTQPRTPSTPPSQPTPRTTSTSFTRSGMHGRPQSMPMPAPTHGEPGHQPDDCPGCRADMDDAIRASLHSAKQEDEKRQREVQEQEELRRVYAANDEENHRRRRLAEEEEESLQRAIQDSRRDAEEEARRSKDREARMLEESRRDAHRQREQNDKLEAEMLEAAKLASAAQDRQRRKELDAMQEAEQKALELSLREQEEEWERRESAERSLWEFLESRNRIDRSATPMSANFDSGFGSRPPSPVPQPSLSPAAVDPFDPHDLDAEYWRFAGHGEAYQLALQMNQPTLAEDVVHAAGSVSTPRTHRPLPPTPETSKRSEEASDELGGTVRKQDRLTAPSQPAALHADSDDAPPAYAEATQAGPSNDVASYAAASPVEKQDFPARYDTVTLEALNRPVLQHRSSSSSSAHSQSQNSPIMSSPRQSFTSSSHPGKGSSTPIPSSEVSSAPPHPAESSPSIPQRGSSHSTPSSKRFSASATSLTSEHRGKRALAGVDFGYGNLPFAPKLDQGRPFARPASASTSASPNKSTFPTTIELSHITKNTGPDAGLSGCSFFILRAHSWKSLLRAIAWYGNSRVEASPSQVAAASDRRTRCLLRAEVEFVTPTRVDIGHVGHYAKAAQSKGSMPTNPSPAHVSLCLSLMPTSSAKSGEASAWLKSEEYQIIKRESRRLDAWYAGKGSTRRLVQLARQPPAMPVAVVQIAQLLHASHTFSAACPSSGSTARHSPRDLHHAIERHDEGYVRKQQAMLSAGSALASNVGDTPRLSLQTPPQTSGSNDPRGGADTNDLDDDDDDDEVDFNDFSLLADGSFDAQDQVLMGKRQRLKAKVKRRLAKRASDGRVVDEDLAAWITPFDLSERE
ncbi:ubiquitin C-terminal hydrolase CreB [Pseudozyma hubeiensis SY62]|uniref:Ubiquitin C-terminal hydrolase CreB n=1 Tax=Pseudozyma hubeiensis (strain SY62) TaxID=1305764 RepID=R9PCD6_PSEHS|nr:ubiquitin C-terminal hydrolase CreB [Pseudozyma hubeiensis SY62]GAC99019.1 ubiquitin C-terminal hydrolase CreB [Pseudozyma hubeiensis SY62]